ASALPYAQTLRGMMIWDDHFLVDGSGIGSAKSLVQCFTRPFLEYYYRPLVSVSFYLDHRLWGHTPFGYHQTNILIHLATTGVLIGFVWSAFRNRSAAMIAGLLFALQPV